MIFMVYCAGIKVGMAGCQYGIIWTWGRGWGLISRKQHGSTGNIQPDRAGAL